MRKKLMILVSALLLGTNLLGCSKVAKESEREQYQELLNDIMDSMTDENEETKVVNEHPTLKDVEKIELTERDKKYLHEYFNDGYQVGTRSYYDDDIIMIYYKDLVWDTGIVLQSRYYDRGLSISVIGENAYITHIAYDNQIMYKFNLNTYEHEIVLEEKDFEPYIYTKASNTMGRMQILKSGTKIYILAEAKEWDNVLEYDTENTKQRLVYKGKFPWGDNYAGMIYRPDINGNYTCVGGYIDLYNFESCYASYELDLESCRVINEKKYNLELDDEDIFLGKIDGEFVKYCLVKNEKQNEITGESTHNYLLNKTNLETGIEESFEIPLLNSLNSTKVQSMSGYTGENLIISDGANTYIVNLENKKVFEGYDLGDEGLNGFWGQRDGEFFYEYDSFSEVENN